MLRLIFCEFWKLKRRKLLFFAYLTSVALPALFALILPEKSMANFMSITRQENGFLLLIPLTVVIAANLFFQEQDLDTLKNLLCIPVTRAQLAVAKAFVLLAFDVAYELAGYAVGLLMAAACGASLEGWGQQLFLNVCAGVLLWAAALDIPPSSPVPLRPVMVTVPASAAVAAGAAGAWISAGLIAPAADCPA